MFSLIHFAAIPPAADGQDCTNIVSQYRSSVVSIHVQKTRRDTGAVTVVSGTGFIVSSGGLMLTNQHIIGGDPRVEDIRTTAAIGSQLAFQSKTNIISQDASDDVAILQFLDTSKIYVPVPIGNPWHVQIGQGLCSMGFPLQAEFQTTQGPLGGKGGGHGLWFTQMPSNKGESGSPVFSIVNGKVIAIKVGDYDQAHNLSYLIPINLASGVLRDYAGVQVPLASQADSSASPVPASPHSLDCTKSDHPFGRGYCSVQQCPQGQWSRGSAALVSGNVLIRQGLETDSVLAGVCGWVEFEMQDANGTIVGFGYGPDRCIGAKPPGPARIENFSPDSVIVPPRIADKVTQIRVSSVCGSSVFAPFGINFGGNTSRGTANVVLGRPPR
jgi:hypothetical protein